MALSPLLTGIGVAAGAALTGASKTLGNTLSFAAELAKGRHDSPGAEIESAEQTAEARRDEILKELRERLEERLKALGVSLAHPLILEASPSGSLRVKNDHPQWRAIEQALGEDESFAQRFANLQSALIDTGADPRAARDMTLELSAENIRVNLPS